MSTRAHRVKKIIYAEGQFFNSGSKLADCIREHEEANDQTNHDGGGIIEITLRGLKEILENKKENKISKEEIKELTDEIAELTEEGKDDDDFISYDLF